MAANAAQPLGFRRAWDSQTCDNGRAKSGPAARQRPGPWSNLDDRLNMKQSTRPTPPLPSGRG